MSIEELGRRAVASKWWRWMPGMAVLNRPMWRVVERVGLPPYMVQGYEEESIDGMTPDLTDPATLGCLLHLVRERWQLPLRSPEYWPADGAEPEYWSMEMYDEYICGDTEAEALVAALEAAP